MASCASSGKEPRGRDLRRRRVATHDQQLKLVGRQLPGNLGRTDRPKAEAADGKTPMTEPKRTPVIPQDLNGCVATIAKDVQRTGKRIALEMLFTKPSQTINPAAEIDRLHRHKDPRLRCGLDHADSHNVRLRPARSGAVAPFHWMRSLPCGPSILIIGTAGQGIVNTPYQVTDRAVAAKEFGFSGSLERAIEECASNSDTFRIPALYQI